MTNDEMRRFEGAHNVILEGREHLSVSGVSEVISFDENEVVMETVRGLLTVGGQGLHVEKLSLDIGELALEGMIDAIVYSDESKAKGSFWSRFF